MNMRFFLSDLPEYNLLPNGDMSQNNAWSAFGHQAVQCWQSTSIVASRLCWFVCKNEEASGATAGLRSGTFELAAGQSYHLSAWVYLASDTTAPPQIRIYADADIIMAASEAYSPGYNGWQQMFLTFSPSKDAPEAFLAAVYEDDTLGAFYLDNVLLYPAAAAITEIEFMPDWNIDLGRTATMTKTRSQAGRLFLYDWNHYTNKSITLDFVPAAQAEIINRFWQNRTKLLLQSIRQEIIYDFTFGIITDDKTPLNQFQSPYTDYYRGKLTFEEL